MTTPARLFLAALALVSGAFAATAGSPQPVLAGDEIAALDLAQRIRDREPGLIVLDARDGVGADDAVLPGAQPLAETDAAAIPDGALVVLYAADDLDRERVAAWRGPAKPNYRRLRGGLRAWDEEVLFPVVRSDASARQQQAFATRAALSRYFGGSPRRIGAGEAADRARSRRGC